MGAYINKGNNAFRDIVAHEYLIETSGGYMLGITS